MRIPAAIVRLLLAAALFASAGATAASRFNGVDIGHTRIFAARPWCCSSAMPNDQGGRLRLLLRDTLSAAEIAADLRRLLREP